MLLRKVLVLLVELGAAKMFLPAIGTAQTDEDGLRFGMTPRLWITRVLIPDEDNVSNETLLLRLYGDTVSVSPCFAQGKLLF